MGNEDRLPDLTMDLMWQEAGQRFWDRTEKRLDFELPRTLDDCIADMDKLHQPTAQSTHSLRVDSAKEWGINILRCIQLLGGVAAQGADIAFAPSSLCFNALSLLLNVPEKIRDFHKAVDGLFETIHPSLSQFQIYKNIEQFKKMEPELKNAIHEVMISVVDICGLSIELRNSGKLQKLKAITKLVLVDGDSGIKKELENLKRLTAAHSSVQATQTLKTVLENNDNVAAILIKASETGQHIDDILAYIANLRDADDKRNAEEARRKHMTNIRERLGVGEGVLKASKETYDKLRKDCINGTCSWIEDAEKHVEYHDWADRSKPGAKPVLLLEGDASTGKSVFMSFILGRLRSMDETQTLQSPRTLIAYYFFPSLTGKSGEDDQPVETALKCIALQLAEQDSAYAKKLAHKCQQRDVEKFSKSATCEELWELICDCLPKGKTPMGPHFLLLDTLGSLLNARRDTVERLLAILGKLNHVDPAKSSVRVLLSVRPDTIRAESSLCGSWPRLCMVQHNAGDISKYIEKELEDKDLFQDTDECLTRTKIRDRLANDASGSYFRVKTALDEINTVVLRGGEEGDVDKVLDATRKNKDGISQTVISTLEETLQEEEITELNELLAWVKFGHVPFNLDTLKSALSLRFNTSPLLKLEKKLEGKYSKIFKVLSSQNVEIFGGLESLVLKTRTQYRTMDEDPKLSATISITKADVVTVQYFLWNFTEKAKHDVFGFQQLETKKGIKSSIGVNKIDAYLAMVLQTFEILKNDSKEETHLSASYLLKHLPHNLEALEKTEDKDELTASEKAEIGKNVFSLFVSGETIERHWDSRDSLKWYKDKDQIRIFKRWLENPSLTSHLGRLDSEWLMEVHANSDPNQALLAKVTKTVARHWLRDTKWEAGSAYKWLQGLQSLSGESEGSEDVPTPNLPLADEMVETTVETTIETPVETTIVTTVHTVGDVEKAANWCKDTFGVSNMDALWHQRLGETYDEIDVPSRAVAEFNTALTFRDPSLEIYNGLAKTQAKDNKVFEACRTMERALEVLENEKPLNKTVLVDIYAKLSKWHMSLENHDSAIKYRQQAISLDPNDHESRYGLLKIYLTTDDKSKATQLLEGLNRTPKAPDEPSMFDNVIDDMMKDWDSEDWGSDDWDQDRIILRCFKVLSGNMELFQLLIKALDGAISRTEKDGQQDDIVDLLLCKGIAIYYFSQDEKMMPVGSAVDCWDRCLKIMIESGEPSSYSTASRLLSAYHFNQAMAAKETGLREPHVKRLEDIAKVENSYSVSAAKSYLASYYAHTGSTEKARTVLQGCIYSALDMLTDEPLENDSEGYYIMAGILMNCGDDLNALSAFSTLAPRLDKGNTLTRLLDFDQDPAPSLSLDLVKALEDVEDELTLSGQIDFAFHLVEERLAESLGEDFGAGATIPTAVYEEFKTRLRLVHEGKGIYPFGYVCDGPCGNRWDFETPMNICKYCLDRGFCDECLKSLKQGTFNALSFDLLVCNRNHKWLPLPKWDRQGYLDAMAGNVKAGGRLEEGVRVGGEVVDSDTWLENMSTDGGFGYI